MREDLNEDSNSLFSGSNIVPLPKRQTVAKKSEKTNNIQEKIDILGYQIIEQLSLITALQVHPSKLCDCIQSYYYQRKLPSVMDAEFNKKQVKQKADFVIALTSLFRKSLTNVHHKFTIQLPSGGIIYYFTEELLDQPRLFVGCQNAEFAANLQREQIKYKEIKLNEFQRQCLLLQGQQIKLFYGYFLNYVLNKKINVDIYANFAFDFSFKDTPLIVKHNESRKENEHLAVREQTCIGQKVGRLYIIKFQSIWYKDDITKLDQRIKQFQSEYQRRNRTQKITHDYQFKICKFSLGLDQEALERAPRTNQNQ